MNSNTIKSYTDEYENIVTFTQYTQTIQKQLEVEDILLEYKNKYGKAPTNKQTNKTVYTALNILNFNFAISKHIIHIAGSSGKGTTALLLAKILEDLHYRIGFITKPHIFFLSERAYAFNKYIYPNYIKNNLQRIMIINKQLKTQGLTPLSYLEALFIIALLFLQDSVIQRRQSLDFLIIEAGRGMKYDYTNIFQYLPKNKRSFKYSLLLTSINKNHTQYLGNTLLKILLNKSSITQTSDANFWLYPTSNLVKQSKFQDKLASHLQYEMFLNKNITYTIHTSLTGSTIKFSNPNFIIKTNLIHKKQLHTLARLTHLILNNKKYFNIQYTNKKIFHKLKLFSINLPGRFHLLTFNKTHFLLDNSHTYDQYKELLNNLTSITYNQTVALNSFIKFIPNDKYQIKAFKHLKEHFLKKHSSFTVQLQKIPKISKSYSLFNLNFNYKSNLYNLVIIFGSIFSLKRIFHNTLKHIIINPTAYNNPKLIGKEISILLNAYKFNNKHVINNTIFTQKQLARHLIKHKNIQLQKNYNARKLNNLIINTISILLQTYDIKGIVSFNPITKYEPNITRINAWLRTNINNYTIAFPFKRDNIWYIQDINTHTYYSSFKQLHHRIGNIIVLLPGLAFDEFGNRLGFGTGTYKRWLKSFHYYYIDILRLMQNKKLSLLQTIIKQQSIFNNNSIVIPVYYVQNSLAYINTYI